MEPETTTRRKQSVWILTLSSLILLSFCFPAFYWIYVNLRALHCWKRLWRGQQRKKIECYNYSRTKFINSLMKFSVWILIFPWHIFLIDPRTCTGELVNYTMQKYSPWDIYRRMLLQSFCLAVAWKVFSVLSILDTDRNGLP